jgi:hypothetical protein
MVSKAPENLGWKVLKVSVMTAALAGGAANAQNNREPNPLPYTLPLRMGQWDHALMSPFVPLAADQDVQKKYLGLRHTETWFDLFLRNSKGQYYLLSNVAQSPPEGGLTAGPWLPVPMRSDNGSLVPDTRITPWGGKATQIIKDGLSVYTAPAKGSTDEVSFNDKTFAWTSRNSDVSLTGELAAPGVQLLLPWRAPNGDTDVMLYTAQTYKVTGKYGGEPVSGYSIIEHMWGTKNYKDTWWVKNRLVRWGFWATTYDDGTTEIGDFMCGEHGARAALIANSKGATVLNTAALNAEAQGDGRVIYTFSTGPQWEFVPEFKGAGGLISVGIVRRIDEKRKIVSSHALNINIGDKMCAPMRLGQSGAP